jgi:hypothetical protein
MLTLWAISGMLAAADSSARAGAVTAAVEISFVTHAGEGAEGQKRFTRDGCYQSESGGSTGGAAYAFERQAGCHRKADVAAVFARLDAIPAAALGREGGATGGSASRHGAMPGSAETQVVLIRGDGSRWVAANKPAADDILRAVNELPSENQWHGTPPEKPVGSGAQLIVVAMTQGKDSHWRFEGSLASDGRWWCHRSLIGTRNAEIRLPRKGAVPITNAPARLGRILVGARPDVPDAAPPANDTRAVEVVWPGMARAALQPARLAGDVITRFIGEVQSLAPVCDLR